MLNIFLGCSGLTSVTIPNSLTSIDENAFRGCNNLTDVYSYMLTLPITSDGAPVFALGFFDYVPLENVTLHVPESSIDVYKETEPWSGFGKIVAINASKHMLTYMVDGKEYKTYEIETGTAITAEKEPTKEGYTFSGWSVIPATMPAKDVTVAGTFTVNKYKLIYMVDGETYKTVEVEYEATITAENEPTKEGYTFSGWGEIPATMPAKDLTVTGTFTINKYKLTYMVDGETYKTAEVEFGTPITTEDEPTKEGYTFSGWSMIPATMPAKDVTITGSFTKGQYQLTYIVDGQNYKTIRMDYGDDITAEDEPTKEGYTFSGWSEIPATMPAKDVIVTGSFTRNILTPSYKRNLSSQTTAVSSIIIGSFVQKSVGFNLSNNGKESINVTKLVVKNPDNNYSVVSTSTDASLLGKLDGGNSIGLSVNLNADFTPCYEWHYTYKGKDFVFCSDTKDPAYNHDITYYVDDKVYVTYEPELGEEIVPEAEPTKEHYTFSGWSEIPVTMPNKDVTVTGTFIINTPEVSAGDANGDGAVNVFDVTAMVNYILGSPNDGFVFAAADVNGDGIVNVFDVTKVVNIILGVDNSEAKTRKAEGLSGTDKLYFEDFEIEPGEEKEVEVLLDNPDAEYRDLQFDLYLPEGITVVQDEDEEFLVDTGSRCTKKHTIGFSYTDGHYVCMLYSTAKNPLTGNSGDILTITLKADDNVAPGVKTGFFRNVSLSKTDATGPTYDEFSFGFTVKGEVDAIEDVDAEAAPANKKILRNGEVIIIRDGKEYDTNGKPAQ